MNSGSRRIALIGPGRLGQAVARRLFEAGHQLVAVIGRDVEKSQTAARFIGSPPAATTDPAAAHHAEVVLLALADDQLADMATKLRRAGNLAEGCVLIHFSGLHTAAVLGDGAALSIHPMQTFADPQRGYEALPGTPCAVEGAEPLLPLAESLVRDLGGTPFHLPGEKKALYHAAACVACNYMATLTATATEMLGHCGFSEEQARMLLGPIIQRTAGNIAEVGPAQALTGPIVRGDRRSIEKHLEALAELPAETARLYRILGKKTVSLAGKKGSLDRQQERELLDLLGKERLGE